MIKGMRADNDAESAARKSDIKERELRNSSLFIPCTLLIVSHKKIRKNIYQIEIEC